MNRSSFDPFGGFGAGSKKKKEDKTSFLKEAKKQRVTREAQRVEEKHALKAQAHIRRFLARKKFLQALEKDTLRKLDEIYTFQSTLTPDQIAEELIKAFHKDPTYLDALVFYPKKSARYHVNFIETLARSMGRILNSDRNLLALFSKDPVVEKRMMRKIKQLFGLVLQLNFNEKMIGNKQFSELCMVWLRALLPRNLNESQMLSEEDQQRVLEIKTMLFDQIAGELGLGFVEQAITYPETFEEQIYRDFIFELATRNSQKLSRSLFDKMTDLCVLPNALEGQSESNKLKFLTLYIRMGLAPAQPATDTIETTHQRVLNYLREIKDCKVLFYKLPLSALEASSELISRLVKEFQDCLAIKIGPTVKQHFLMDIEEEEEKDAAKSDDTDKDQEVAILKSIRKSHVLKLDSAIIVAVCDFFSYILYLAAATSNQSKTVSAVCNSLLLLRFWLSEENRNNVLQLLAFKTNVYLPLFKCIEETKFDQDRFVNNPDQWLPILRAFCKVFYKKLMITDDEEFAGNKEIIDEKDLKNNISLSKITRFCGFLNGLVFQIIWERITKLNPIKKSAITVLKELYNRDGRLKFTNEPNFWNIPILSDAFYDIQTKNPLKKELVQEILRKVPHMISFENRLKLFQHFIEVDKSTQDRFPQFSDSESENETDKKIVRIRRNFVLEDGYEYLAKRKNMKSLFQIKFISDIGIEEEGIDGGGLLKEFMIQLSKVAFDTNYGLFEEKEDKTLVPNPNSHLVEDHLKLFTFLGRMVGKAIYENNLLESTFSVIFLNRILGVKNTINELKYSDQVLYKNLLQLKHKEGFAENLGLTFSVSENVMGVQKTYNLKPNGENIEVDESNKLEYIDLLCSFRLNYQIDQQSKAFAAGMKSCIDPAWIQMFNHEELQLLICGSRRKGFDVNDLQENTEYNNYTPNDLTIQHFWSVLHGLSDEEKNLFLLFVTGCSRPPTLGFKYLNPKFCIQMASFDESQKENLPTASTCMNLLKLPDYKNKEKLRSKLVYAITSNSGFEMG